MSKTLVISITIPDGVEVDIQRGSNVVPQAERIFADDLEELGPIPSPPPEAQIGFSAPGVRTIAAAQPQQFQPFGSNPAVQPQWFVGQIHQQGHKPLKARANGAIYCPTPLGPDGAGGKVWCNFPKS